MKQNFLKEFLKSEIDNFEEFLKKVKFDEM